MIILHPWSEAEGHISTCSTGTAPLGPGLKVQMIRTGPWGKVRFRFLDVGALGPTRYATMPS